MNVIVLPFFMFLFFGCYNNSHIRTQRVLQESERVFSVSASYNALGNIDNRRVSNIENATSRYIDHIQPYAPVAAIRTEISILEGYKSGELGFYLGGGLNAMVDGPTGLVGGEFNKYLHLKRTRPLKAGVSLELNRSDNGRFALHSIQSIKTTTTKKSPLFFGIHSIFTKSNMEEEYNYYLDNPGASWFAGGWDSNHSSYERIVKYEQGTRGLGFSSGVERFFGNASLIVQVDFSFVKNSIVGLNKDYVVGGFDGLSNKSSSWEPIASASLAFSFFPNPSKQRSAERRKRSENSTKLKPKKIKKNL